MSDAKEPFDWTRLTLEDSGISETASGLTPSLLIDLIIAWAEGEISEGCLRDATGSDAFALRGLKNDAIARALKFVDPIMQASTTRYLLERGYRQTSDGGVERIKEPPES